MRRARAGVRPRGPVPRRSWTDDSRRPPRRDHGRVAPLPEQRGTVRREPLRLGEAFYERFLERTDKILLVGCGTGRDLIALLQCGHRVDGVDLVREAVVRARQRLAEHKFEGSVWVGDIETIELVERYDVFVFSWFCYAYIPESARRVRILKRLAEHLAPEGRILISYVPTDKARRAIRVARLVARLTRSDWRPELGDSVAATGDSMSSVSFQHFFRTGDADAEAAAAGLRVLAQVPSDQVITMALAKPSLG
ncbi:MAG: hypothetical protein DME08_12605 [Candidatus Rokuibacteriota bacterium]|nr:MAG: hypothetical protein DME08_12605 [Candidatus Rokubacteria bacterium]